MARYARELHDGADESEDELVMDEAPSQIISTCSNFIQEYVYLYILDFVFLSWTTLIIFYYYREVLVFKWDLS